MQFGFQNQLMQRFIQLIAFVFVGLLLTACQTETDTQKVFRYNENAGILTLDPAFAKDLPHIWACNQLYNGLVAFDSNMQVVPSLAKSWKVEDEGTLYTFALRTDVYFHEHAAFKGVSRKFVASDVQYSFQRFLDPKLASPGIWIFNQVERKGDSLAIRILNDSTLQIQLKRPFPAFLGILGMAYASVVPFEVVEAMGTDFRQNPSGTGPFALKLWEEGVRLVLRKNPNYFEFADGQRLPFLEAISISFLSDKQTAFMEFIKGNLDFMSGVDARFKDELLTRQGNLRSKYQNRINLKREAFLNTEYLGFFLGKEEANLNAEQKRALRQVVNHAIDREKMLKYLRNNVGIVAHGGMIPNGLPGYDLSQRIGYSYDPDKAGRLMEQYNLRGQTITISVTEDYVDLVKFIQSELCKIGIIVVVDVMPTATLRQLRAHGKLEIFRASWVADYPDAENYLSLFYGPNKSPAGPNYTHFQQDRFDSIFEQAYEITDPVKRSAVYRQLDSMVMSEAPVVPLYYDEVLRFSQKNVRGLSGNPTNQLDLKLVWKY